MRFDVENPMVIDSLWRNERTITDDYHADLFDDEELEVTCACCGEKMCMEDAVESEIWEDTYLCDYKLCKESHYTGWSESLKLQKYYR